MTERPSPDDDQALFLRYNEGELNEAQMAALEERLKTDVEFRAAFADWVQLEGMIRAEAEVLFADRETDAEAAGGLASPRSGRGRQVLAAAAMVAIGLAIGWLLRPAEPGASSTRSASPSVAAAAPVATLADIKAAKWGSSSLPTEEGARLAPGKLDLLEGLATVRFDSGVTVTLEAPATLEVESATRCRLVEGAAVAWVPDGAEGFQIQTEDALVTDYGTRFGVIANREGQSEVLVLEGEVGVTHPSEAEEKRLLTGEMVRYDAETLVPSGTSGEDERPRFHRDPDGRDREDWIEITTAEGRGKDTYVRQGDTKAPFGDSPLLMVKHSTEFAGNRRKAWLTFDLEGRERNGFEDVELDLSIQASGLGYASVVPDATFAVYGLRDESEDDAWDEATMRWAEAPGNELDHGFRLREDEVRLLGEFIVEQGVSSGSRKVSGEALRDFLQSDSNDLVTLVIVRLTDETDRHGLVHAFASAEHPAAMAPTLRWRKR